MKIFLPILEWPSTNLKKIISSKSFYLTATRHLSEMNGKAKPNRKKGMSICLDIWCIFKKQRHLKQKVRFYFQITQPTPSLYIPVHLPRQEQRAVQIAKDTEQDKMTYIDLRVADPSAS